MNQYIVQPVHPGHPYIVYGMRGAAPPPQTLEDRKKREEYLTKHATIHAKNLNICKYNYRQEINNNRSLPPPLMRSQPPIVPGTFHRYLNEEWIFAINTATMIISIRERIAQRKIAGIWRYNKQYRNKLYTYMRWLYFIIMSWFHTVIRIFRIVTSHQ